MKLNLCQDLSVAETEITIRYAEMDTSIQRLIEKIEQHKSFIVGYQQNRQFQLPDHFQRLPPDGTGGPQERYRSFHWVFPRNI